MQRKITLSSYICNISNALNAAASGHDSYELVLSDVCLPLLHVSICCFKDAYMYNNRTIPFFIETGINGKCITAVRGSLGYTPV